jgi:hypothetical protein
VVSLSGDAKHVGLCSTDCRLRGHFNRSLFGDLCSVHKKHTTWQLIVFLVASDRYRLNISAGEI